MFIKEDNTYNELREKSILQWLEQMEEYDDVAVRGGVRVTREYLTGLKEQIRALEEKNALKDKFLRQMKDKYKRR